MQKRKVSPKRKAEDFRKLGAIVVDTMALLNSLPRIHQRLLLNTNPYYREKLERAKDAAMLVASHALAPVLEALNLECLDWETQDPEWWAAQQAAGIAAVEEEKE